jgi:Zn-dependent peptidase ImmA (M78 family)
MSKEDPRKVFGRRLEQARLMRGLSLRELAEATGGKVSYNALHRYEHGDMMPGDDVLMAVADVLDKPLDFFFRPFTVELQEVEFRKKARLSPKLEESIREQALDFFERYLEIEQILGISGVFKNPLENFDVASPEQAETAAERIREEWGLGKDPLPNVLQMLETNGIKTLTVEAPDSFDGFSGWADGHPVVVVAEWLNRDLPRKRFTTMHEVAHILIRPSCSLSKDQERSCDRFAGAVLMPRESFEGDLGGYRRRVSLEELKDLKSRWGVSIAAIVHRAYDLEFIEESLYHHFFRAYNAAGYRRSGEPGEYKGTEASSRFEQLVLRATVENTISESKGAGLLNEPLVEFKDRLRFS